MSKEELEKQVKKFAISYWRKRNRIGDNFSVLDLINFTTDFVTEIATKELEKENAELKELLDCPNCCELEESECETCVEFGHFRCKGKEQLAKAKEIIKELLDTQSRLDPYRDIFKDRILKAEQFISEVEK